MARAVLDRGDQGTLGDTAWSPFIQQGADRLSQLFVDALSTTYHAVAAANLTLGGRLACRVGAGGGVRRRLLETVRVLQRAEHNIEADGVLQDAGLIFGREGFPVVPHGLQEVGGAGEVAGGAHLVEVEHHGGALG